MAHARISPRKNGRTSSRLCLLRCAAALLIFAIILATTAHSKAATELGVLGEQEFQRAAALFSDRVVSDQQSQYWKLMQAAADKGHPQAQYFLGLGYSVKSDYSNAAVWFQKAALQEDVDAQLSLGMCYLDGYGVRKNRAEAAKWFLKAALRGNVTAQNSLGVLYSDGDGVPLDMSQALKWWHEAAVGGNHDALYNIGEHYRKGVGVRRDDVEAYACYSIAAGHGNEKARARRELIDTAWSLEPQLLARGQQRARDLEAEFKSQKQALASQQGAGVSHGNEQAVPKASGSGFVLSTRGLVVTNWHVVEGAGRIEIRLGKVRVAAKVVVADKGNDLVVLRAETTFPEALSLISSRKIQLGAEVFTVGFPNPDMQGVSPKFTRGEISSVAGPNDDPRYFQISVPVQPGNSGGALCNSNGEVVGVVAAKLSASTALKTSGALPENVNYAIKSSYLLALFESISASGEELAENRSAVSSGSAVSRAENAAVLVFVF